MLSKQKISAGDDNFLSWYYFFTLYYPRKFIAPPLAIVLVYRDLHMTYPELTGIIIFTLGHFVFYVSKYRRCILLDYEYFSIFGESYIKILKKELEEKGLNRLIDQEWIKKSKLETD